jgi:hypothetical protein
MEVDVPRRQISTPKVESQEAPVRPGFTTFIFIYFYSYIY